MHHLSKIVDTLSSIKVRRKKGQCISHEKHYAFFYQPKGERKKKRANYQSSYKIPAFVTNRSVMRAREIPCPKLCHEERKYGFLISGKEFRSLPDLGTVFPKYLDNDGN